MGNYQHHPRLNYCNHLMAFFLRQLFHVCPWPRPRKTQLNTGRLKKLSGTQSRWDLCIHADGVSCRGACCDWRLQSVFHCVLCSPFVAVMVGLFPLNSCWWRLNSPADPWVISTVRTLFWKTFTRRVSCSNCTSHTKFLDFSVRSIREISIRMHTPQSILNASKIVFMACFLTLFTEAVSAVLQNLLKCLFCLHLQSIGPVQLTSR